MHFVPELRRHFINNRNEIDAKAMQAYMKNKFVFFGIKSVQRKTILKEAIHSNKEEVTSNISEIAKVLYSMHEREFHYCAMETFARFKKRNYLKADIEFITYLITTNSHWDSVDFIAKHILGQFLLEHPYMREETISKLSQSQNMWLNRASILFQLGYKEKTDAKLLFQVCNAHKHSDEFFIQKAIGWALREYAKYNSDAVINVVKTSELKPLSQKEALKHFK
ncbi:DNA alkylation repair protein [Winogradskyella alexanderae]|uniref:DNA alkylation repair protein n=1 Tax=Winogradskyella alexanderae TaxID=2877123 RepID=A0ABS7XP38_9FLAO|nr:DNA alkylation repair protein [Winogradskyella alexanderae]MCA0131772.1 DNA alkylation repair protein [Winogradskyella alexanderae]